MIDNLSVVFVSFLSFFIALAVGIYLGAWLQEMEE